MYDSEVNSEYNLLSCHACLSSSRQLTMVGDLVDVFRKICDNSQMILTPETNVCWECLALLKKVRAFKKKVDNAQKILDYGVDKHTPSQASLSNLTTSFMETTTFVPILYDDPEEDKFGDVKDVMMDTDEYIDMWRDRDEQMFKIEDVRGQCDIVDTKSFLDLSSGSSECPVKLEPELAAAEAERAHRCWQSAALLVYKRICTHKYACHFLRPVSDELAPEYSRIVKRPMDLSSIKRNIKEGVIRTTGELQRDLLLMFSNALMYNGSEHVIYHMTQELRQEALQELSLMIAAQARTVAPPARRRRHR